MLRYRPPVPTTGVLLRAVSMLGRGTRVRPPNLNKPNTLRFSTALPTSNPVNGASNGYGGAQIPYKRCASTVPATSPFFITRIRPINDFSNRIPRLQPAGSNPLFRTQSLARLYSTNESNANPHVPHKYTLPKHARLSPPDPSASKSKSHQMPPPTRLPSTNPEPEPVKAQIPKTLEYHLTKEKTWFGRLSLRLKWALIRNARPFNMDEKLAFFSYIVWGHILWIVLGTTTFVSLVVWAITKFRAEDALSRFLSNFVTKEIGLKVVFDEAIIPDWKSRSIALHNVRVQRRPQSPQDDGNYTQFDVLIDTLNVKISVKRWLAGNGFVECLSAKGVRGTLDRRFLKTDPEYDPTKHRKKPKRGDFSFLETKLDDVVLTIIQPNPQPVLELRLFSCEFPRLRKQWLLYDALNAHFCTGSYDNAMFSLHERQLPTHERVQRLRVDDVDVCRLNSGASGMFGWIESGRCDFLADIVLPRSSEVSSSEQLQDLFERWEAQIKSLITKKQTSYEIKTSVERDIETRESRKTVTIDLRVRFRNLRARAPLYTSRLTYWNNALIHPIIAYVNSRDTYIPVHCYVAKRLYDFDGSWTLYDSGLMGDISSELYNAFAQDAQDEAARSLRIRKVGFWSLQFMAQLVLLTLGIVA